MLSETDLKVDIFRSPGIEGNGTWTLRLTHLPSGIQVTAEGDFVKDEDPEPAMLKARADLVTEIDARLNDA